MEMSLREKLIIDNQALVTFTIVRYFNENLKDFDELFEEGTISLIKAIDSFDTSRGELSTFCITKIKNDLLTYLTTKRKRTENLTDTIDFSDSLTEIKYNKYYYSDFSNNSEMNLKLWEISKVLNKEEMAFLVLMLKGYTAREAGIKLGHSDTYGYSLKKNIADKVVKYDLVGFNR